ncbi:MAG: DNA ligase, partial [Thermosphaera sp.]
MSMVQRDLHFKVIVDFFKKLETTTARTQLTAILVNLFKQTPPEVIDKVVYIIQTRLWPDWKGLPELGIAERLLIKAISSATHSSEKIVEEVLKSKGDAGLTVEFLKLKMVEKGKATTLFSFVEKKEELTVNKVYDVLTRIALAQGEGSKDLKIRLLAGLLSEASPEEAKYIVRFVEGKLRLGIGDATIMDALAVVYAGSASFRPLIERAYNLRADLGEVAKILATSGIEAIKNITPSVGVPIRPMLAERLSDPKEILEKVGNEAFVEYKYDGERAQIHKDGNKVIIYSRRLENITFQYPDVVEM